MFWHEDHRHLCNIDCLKACTACLVCFVSTVNGHCKKKPLKTGASSRHITNLKQSFWTFDIYDENISFGKKIRLSQAQKKQYKTFSNHLDNLIFNTCQMYLLDLPNEQYDAIKCKYGQFLKCKNCLALFFLQENVLQIFYNI